MSGGIKVSNRDNPIVFFDVSVGGKEIGRLKIEVIRISNGISNFFLTCPIVEFFGKCVRGGTKKKHF